MGAMTAIVDTSETRPRLRFPCRCKSSLRVQTLISPYEHYPDDVLDRVDTSNRETTPDCVAGTRHAANFLALPVIEHTERGLSLDSVPVGAGWS